MGLLIALMACSATATADARVEFKYGNKVTALVEPYLKNDKANAISIRVISNGKTWSRRFGTLGATPSKAPNEKKLYEIGSIYKVFTSLLLAHDVESGKLKLNDPISIVMKELSASNPSVGDSITFKHLSHHISGLPPMPNNDNPKDDSNPFGSYDRRLLTDYMLPAKLVRKPDAAHEYSNLAVGLLGDLLASRRKLAMKHLSTKK